MIFLLYRRSLSVGITEGSASAKWTTEGSAEGLAEGTFGRSLEFTHVSSSTEIDVTY